MWRVLVRLSLGHTMVKNINEHRINLFQSAFSNFEQGGGSGIASSNSQALYSAINIFGIQTYIGWEVFFSILFNLVLFFEIIHFYKTTHNISWKQNIFIYMAVAILNIFCLNMSKEPYQLLFFVLMSMGLMHTKGYWKKYAWIVFVIILNILYSRKYFILTLGFFIGIQYIAPRFFTTLDLHSKAGKKKLIFRSLAVFIILALFHFIAFHFIAQTNEETYEDLIAVNDRDQSRKSVATSEIVPWFGSGNQVAVTLEFFVKIFRLSLPIELLIIGKFTYVFIIIYQALLSYFFIKAFATKTESKEIKGKLTFNAISEDENEEQEDGETEEYEDYEEEETDSEPEDRKQNRILATYFYVSFLLCSACFEPDFGSWTRHIGVVFPVLLYIL